MSNSDLPSRQLDPVALADLELFLAGALAPQERFELPATARTLLRDPNNVRLAIWSPDAPLEVIEPPRHADFTEYRRTTAQLREELAGLPVLAVALRDFPTLETEADLRAWPGAIVLHVIEPGPADHFARVRAAEFLARALGPGRAVINLLPFAHDNAELLARVLRNYGADRILEPHGAAYRPEIAALRDDAVPPRHRQGFCVWFTGLPSAGKSTIADQLVILLRERGRRVTVLDGDVVRTHLSKGLGFSREDRETNIRRIGWVAAEIVRHHGVAVVAAVSPFAASRDDARRMVGENFFLVHVATPAEVCEDRDVKGFYAQARAGKISGFTGVDDPYEIPASAELTLPTIGRTPHDSAAAVLRELTARGLIESADA